MHLLFVGDGYAIAEKPAGLLSEPGGGSKESFFDALQEFLENESGKKQPLFPVHRLDRAVGGVMAFATEKKTAALLSLPSAMQKYYLAVVKGRTEKCGTYRDFLYKDPKTNKTFIAKSQRKGVREAVLHYKTLAEAASPGGDTFSLVLVALETGRSHQIRVQFASRKHPVIGDGKYGGSDNAAKNLALFSFFLAIEATPNTASLAASSATDDKNPFVLHENCRTYCCFPPRVYPWTLFAADRFSAAEEIISRKS